MTFWPCRGNGLKDKIKFEIYDFITLTNNYNTNIVRYAQGIQVPLQSCSWINGFLDQRYITIHFTMSAGVNFYFIWILYWYRWRYLSGFSAMKHMNWKTHFSATSSDELFWTLSNIFSHCIHIEKSSCTQLTVTSGCFWLLAELVTGTVARNLCVH